MCSPMARTWGDAPGINFVRTPETELVPSGGGLIGGRCGSPNGGRVNGSAISTADGIHCTFVSKSGSLASALFTVKLDEALLSMQIAVGALSMNIVPDRHAPF